MRILGAKSPGELRIAVLKDDLLEDYAIWRPHAPDGLGDVYAARITARVPAMAGAFVALPVGEGFLPDTQGAAGLAEGACVTVCVTRSAQGGKGPRLRLVGVSQPGAQLGLIRRGDTPLHRFAEHYPSAEILLDDALLAAALPAAAFSGRLRLVHQAFDDTVQAEIDALGEAWATLPGGLRAGFFPTPALTAIDMDGGATTAASGQKAALQFAANQAALPSLARQIRLRNLSGAILVDVAGVPAKRRASLGAAFSAALAQDPAHPRLLGFTQLGLAEISRPRTTPPLHELLAGPHPAGLAALRGLAREAAKNPSLRPALRASPEVINALESDRAALADFDRLSTYPLTLRSDPGLPGCVCLDEST
jgi:Arc/MetJ family transcription regulator